jgi:hypothetical protein
MNENTMKKWKVGAVIGAIWGLSGFIFFHIIVPHVWDLYPSEYTMILLGLSGLVFLPFLVFVITAFFPLNTIFPNIPIELFVLFMFLGYGALIGAGIGYLIDKYRRWL